MRVRHSGFTLIELMIVVAIIGILSAFAVSAYQNYVIRSKVSEGMVLAGRVKNAVAEYCNLNNTFPTTNAEIGLNNPVTSDYVEKVEVASGGRIVITFKAKALGVQNGENTLTFKPTSVEGQRILKWGCQDEGTLLEKYRPGNCHDVSGEN